MEVPVQDHDVRIMDDVRGLRLSRPFFAETDRFGFVRVQLQPKRLDVEHDRGHILSDPRDGGKLVQHPFNAHGCDRGTGQGGQQHATQGVANGRAKSSLERLGCELAVGRGKRFLVGFDPHWGLKVLHYLNHDAPFA